MQMLAHRLGAGGSKEPPTQQLADPFDAERRVLLLEFEDLLLIAPGSRGWRGRAVASCKPTSPNFLYNWIQRLRQLGAMPISAQTSSSLNPSSSRSRTALSLASSG